MQRNINKRWGVVFVQMHVTDIKEKNIQTAVRLIRTAVKRYNPKLVVLPELFTTVWNKKFFDEYAEVIPNGETTTMLSNLARELNIYLIGGSIPERDLKTKYLYNTTTVWSPEGTLIAKYRKIHLMDIEMENDVYLRETEWFKHGDTLTTFEIDGIKIGLGIGYDLSFGELATIYRKHGVDMLIYPAVYPKTLGYMHWEQLNRTRAIDNQVFVLGVSTARNDLMKYDMIQHGHSMLVDYMGRVLVRGGEDEEVFYWDIDFTGLDRFRSQLNLYTNKRTDVYDTIVKM